jgi:hypothetical protein
MIYLPHACVRLFYGWLSFRLLGETSSNRELSTVQWALQFGEDSGVHRPKISPINRTFASVVVRLPREATIPDKP